MADRRNSRFVYLRAEHRRRVPTSSTASTDNRMTPTSDRDDSTTGTNSMKKYVIYGGIALHATCLGWQGHKAFTEVFGETPRVDISTLTANGTICSHCSKLIEDATLNCTTVDENSESPTFVDHPAVGENSQDKEQLQIILVPQFFGSKDDTPQQGQEIIIIDNIPDKFRREANSDTEVSQDASQEGK
ncbi:uncharacterized protein I206_100075 [Kwoniella pini CBS 10737]|uniref:Uncharacterized protein n=1 Tax=Kwoniella pini CBS 10737 TaxID=1296096 RepID=A0A1B9HSG3_9TREE|nr:uncharacterized protein I206_07890 [Kwoniella pini CBS 10737]OCF46219.1 hypothetical protein I206_07890 [Kwoniella pini CBS 10737]